MRKILWSIGLPIGLLCLIAAFVAPALPAAMEPPQEAYVPKVPGKLADLTIDAEKLLRGLPSVTKVEVLVKAAQPKTRILHIRDKYLMHRQRQGQSHPVVP